MIIDNFQLLQLLFEDVRDNTFLYVQIVRRAKDLPDFRCNESPIATFIIRTYAELISKQSDIINICEICKARAYITITPKSYLAVHKEYTTAIVTRNERDAFRISPGRLINHCIGAVSGKPKKWMIDIDDLENAIPIIESVVDICKHDNTHIRYYTVVPTVQGCHVIISPFNKKAFYSKHPDVAIHTNSIGTLLYYPESLSKINSNQDISSIYKETVRRNELLNNLINYLLNLAKC